MHFPEAGRSTEGDVTEIVALSLDQNKQGEMPPLEVLGLETVGDHLALILVEGNHLVVRAFSTDGNLIGEARVPDFVLAGPRDKDKYPKAYYERYQALGDAQDQTLILNFVAIGFKRFLKFFKLPPK